MIGDLLLLSGNDIPFPEARVNIHQPTLKEISFIGEEAFFMGCGFLNFSKELLSEQDKINLSNYDDFDIFMSTMINKTDMATRRCINNAKLVLNLMFPLYGIEVRNDAIVLIKNEQEFIINKNNFLNFKKIIIKMFCLDLGENSFKEEYNPVGDMSKKIAEKFKKRHEKLLKIENEQNKNNKNFSILSRYVSILSVGCQKDLNNLMQYTIYQLYDEFQRFQMKVQWDAYIQAKMAGAQNLEDVDNWMIDLHHQEKNKNKK